MTPTELQWKPHNPDREVCDGSIYLVAINVKNNETGKMRWEVDKIRVACDWDGESGFFELIYADSDEPYDSWSWEDFEYSIKLQD